ncbi:MAG: DegT/DnrJ/EryC1/StrS family aminotransferase [Phycisphaerales bacterium]|jgi:dTDP-4-amino-4,6-dideoxygalactose transaminase
MTYVPLLDLRAQYTTIREDVVSALLRVLDSTAFAGGPFVADFEKEFASYCGCEFTAGVSNGTSALWLSLLALGVGAGDEVITVPNTFIATAEAISFCGATPVFVDVDPDTYTMNPDLLEAAITPWTKAIIPVHLYGQPADMDPILEIARRHGLYVVEDACQAHGALYKGRRAGTIGDAGCFSFYPGKNLGAYGEAGAVVTNDAKLAEKIRILRDHGQTEKYKHLMIGWNDRMDGFQGAILSIKLKHLDKWNNARREHAGLYNSLLEGVEGVVPPREAAYARHIYHVYAIRVPRRDEMIAALREKDIWCGIHYPIPIHLQKAYEPLGYRKGSFPVAERCAEEYLSLPMFPELTTEQIESVAAEIVGFLAETSTTRPCVQLEPAT